MSALPASALHELLGPHEERSCFTCASSPPYPGPSGCAQLTGDNEQDEPICGYCDASGANDNTAEPGWPLDRLLVCPRWTRRGLPASTTVEQEKR